MNFLHCEGMVYNIRRGDTLYSISRRYNVPLAMLLRANPFADMYNLQIGDEICIPLAENGNNASGGRIEYEIREQAPATGATMEETGATMPSGTIAPTAPLIYAQPLKPLKTKDFTQNII